VLTNEDNKEIQLMYLGKNMLICFSQLRKINFSDSKPGIVGISVHLRVIFVVSRRIFFHKQKPIENGNGSK
jgi:hypothetical protein